MYVSYKRSLEEDDDNNSSSEESELADSTNEESYKQMKLQRALKKIDTLYNPVLVNSAMEEIFCFVGETDDDHKIQTLSMKLGIMK